MKPIWCASSDTIVEVMSLIFGKKTRARKRALALLTPFTVRQRPKKRKNEVCFEPLWPVDPSLTKVLMKGVSSDGEPKTIRGALLIFRVTFFGYSFKQESGLRMR